MHLLLVALLGTTGWEYPVDAGQPEVESPPLLSAEPAPLKELPDQPEAPAPKTFTIVEPKDKAAKVESAPPAPREFVKGELSSFLGSGRLVTKNNRVGVALGLDQVGPTFYLLAEPQVDLRFLEGKLALGLGLPLRLEVLDLGGRLFDNAWALRKEDWDQPGDFAKVLKYVTYGRKEDRLYVNLGQSYATTIGHGALVRRYSPNVDVDVTRVSAQLDAYNDYGGFEVATNDVVEWNLLSGLAFVKPLSPFFSGVVGRSLSVGVSAATDLSAPRRLLTEPSGERHLDAQGRIAASRSPVLLYGVDAEVKVVKTDAVDIKPYVDFSLLQGGDAGLTVGALGRFNTLGETTHAFRVVAELRSLGARYEAAYFDTFYEVERYAARELPRAVTDDYYRYLTKYEDVMSGRRGERLGYYLEGSWGIRSKLAVTLAFEGASSVAEKNLVAHLEVPALGFLQFFGSFYKRGFTDFGQAFAMDRSTVFFAGARLRILPILFINARAYKTFRLDREVVRYQNNASTFGWSIDAELGWEFAPSKPN